MRAAAPAVTVTAFFAGRSGARAIFRALDRLLRAAGPLKRRVTRAQVAYRRDRAFAWAWIPGRWLKGTVAPLVLSLALPRRDRSRRWKQVLPAGRGRWMHHLELWSARDLDGRVRSWIREAWVAAA